MAIPLHMHTQAEKHLSHYGQIFVLKQITFVVDREIQLESKRTFSRKRASDALLGQPSIGENCNLHKMFEIFEVGKFTWLVCKIIVAVFSLLGKASMKKKRFLWGIVRIPSPPPDPNSGNLVLFFGSQNSRFESQFRTKNTIYTI